MGHHNSLPPSHHTRPKSFKTFEGERERERKSCKPPRGLERERPVAARARERNRRGGLRRRRRIETARGGIRLWKLWEGAGKIRSRVGRFVEGGGGGKRILEGVAVVNQLADPRRPGLRSGAV